MADKFNARTTAEEAASVFHEQIAGKVVLLTGASPGGLGGEVARVIAKHDPKLLILAGRDEKKIQQTENDILRETPNASLRKLRLNLTSNADVRKAAEEVLGYDEIPDVLILNAGVMASPYSKTVDGFESQFAANYIGHFLFTELLLPKLLETPSPRIVQVSSWGHNTSNIRWDDPGFQDGKVYDAWQGYGQGKTAQILNAVYLADKYRDRGLTAFALMPGTAKTELGRSVPAEGLDAFIDKDTGKLRNFHGAKTVPECSATTIVAAFRPDIASSSPAYLEDCQIANVWTATGKEDIWAKPNEPIGVRDYAMDKDNAQRLYTLTREWLGMDK